MLPSDIKSLLKSATLDELKEMERALPIELKSRQASHALPSVITFTDGASRGNPGHAGAGALLYDGKNEKLGELFKYLGVCTNNEAEYRALLMALERASQLTSGTLHCYLDSQLTVRQLNGEYAIKSEKLAKFHREVLGLVQKFQSVIFEHVPREHPKLQLADKLANKAIDLKDNR